MLIQRPQMEIGGYSLGELVQLRREKEIPQLGLSNQDQLQDLKFIGVNVGNHPQVFQRFRLEVLGLVNDQDCSSPIGVLSVQKILQSFEKIWIIALKGLAE